jgi:hypothetical protein
MNFFITFSVLILVMALMALKLILGRSDEIQRGCGTDCECIGEKPARHGDVQSNDRSENKL